MTSWDYPASYGMGGGVPAEWDLAADAAEVLRDALTAAFGEHSPVGLRSVVCKGHPAQVLGDAADGAEMLVVGSRGHGSERRVFGPLAVSPEEIERLRDAAQAPGVYAHFPSRADEILDLAVAISRADRFERDDPAYAQEMAEWVRRDPDGRDGVPTSVIPAVSSDRPRHTDIPLRDFEVGVPGAQMINSGADERHWSASCSRWATAR